MYLVKYSLLYDVARWRSCSVVAHGCVNRIRLWLVRRDDRSGVLIGADGTRRFNWPERVQGQVATSCYSS